MSLFGAQTQPSTNIFSNTSTQQQPGQAASGNIFGNSGQPSTSGTSPFGTTSTATNIGAGTSSGGLFGNAGAQQQQQPGAGLFGNTTATQQPATGGSFGSTNTQTQQPAGTNLFGAATPQPAGSIFGNAGAQQQQQPQTSTQPSTSIFGNTSTTTTGAPAGNIFGNTAAPQQQPGGLFGAPTTTQQSTGGGLFGGTNAQPAGTNLFGNTGTQQQQQPQSGFGGATAQQPAAGGLFGTSTAQPSMFGSTTQAPGSGGLFATTTAQAPTTGGGLFGSTNTGSNPLFGNKAPSSIFGTAPASSSAAPNFLGQPSQGSTAPSLFAQSQQAPAGSLFGSTNQPAQSTTTRGLFGSTLGAPAFNSLLASRSIAPTQQQDPQSQYAVLEQKIQAIVQAWNPASPECRFQHYFYNLVPPEQVSAFGRPANAMNEALWQRAVRDNPNPSCMVPVLAVGFDDLRQRVDGQSKQAAEQQKGLMELKKRLESLSAKHNDNNASRLERIKALQSQIQHRLLCLIQHMHLMLPTVRSTAIRPEEDALRVALEEIEEDIKRPGGVGKMRGKLNELWALVGSINAARERGRKVGLDGTSDWTVVDEEGLKQIAQILSNQQVGLQHLTQVLQRDLKDLEVIYGKES